MYTRANCRIPKISMNTIGNTTAASAISAAEQSNHTRRSFFPTRAHSPSMAPHCQKLTSVLRARPVPYLPCLRGEPIYTPHNFAPAHPTSASAQATPNGTFAVSGFSSEIERSGRCNRAIAQNIRPTFPSVCPNRPCQITMPSAIRAFTSAATKNTCHSLSTPRIAPEAPTSFQSPNPNACKATKGNNRSIARPRPASDDLAPGKPKQTVLRINPKAAAGTVSQFGIRRLRQSVTPAISATMAARLQRTWLPVIAVRSPRLAFADSREPTADSHYRTKLETPCRSATTRLAFSARSLAFGSSSRHLLICGSHSARDFNPSSCP